MIRIITIFYILFSFTHLFASTKVSQGNLSELYSDNQCNRQGNFYIICDNSKEVSMRMKEKLNIHHKNRVLKGLTHQNIKYAKNHTNHEYINPQTSKNLEQKNSFITMTNKIANYHN